MANNGNNSPIPQMRNPRIRPFPCSHCLEHWVIEKLVANLYERAAIDEGDATSECYRISRELMERHMVSVTPHRIRKKIIELRRSYVSFRNFTKKQGVSYVAEINLVEVDAYYVQTLMNQESPAETMYRLEGLPTYEDLHYIFKKKKFPKFEIEPPAAFEATQEFSYSSDDESE